ncbi:MAG: VCBS repeat-containing protein [Deltaproteobacteria bacterium]|nr:VCBS repeat-containing protein [Deltaproteobacteria bacterium]
MFAIFNITTAVFISILFLTGCSGPQPLSMVGHGVEQIKSETVWSRDFGPERSGHFRALAIADFNNDGKLDIVGGSYEPGAIFLWYGDGLGYWERIQRFKIKADVRYLTVGDVNNDGWLDIVSSSRGDTKGIGVWINENGVFREGQRISEKELYEGMKLVDINNDGKLDVISANSSDVSIGGIQVWLGVGDGTFITETGPTRKGIYFDVAVGDINNDGKLDIVGAGWGQADGAIRTWLGNGDGTWSSAQMVDKGSFWGIDTADVNNDGNLDIVGASNFEGVTIYYGDGKGGFPTKEKLAETGSFWRARVVDLNKDGLMDIIASSNDGHGLVVWYQHRIDKKYMEKKDSSGCNCTIEWIAKNEGLPVEGFYFDIAIADFNLDGRADLAASTHGEGIKVWFRSPGEPAKIKKEIVKEKEIIEKPVEKIVEREKIVEKLTVPVFYTAVFFDTGKAEIRPESKVILSSVAEFLKRVTGTIVKLEGYADPRRIMSKEFPDNQVLSEVRVKKVNEYLINAGIPIDRMEVRGFGDSNIKYKGDDPNSMQMNRRVDITIIYKSALMEKEGMKNDLPDKEKKGMDNKEIDKKEISPYKKVSTEGLEISAPKTKELVSKDPFAETKDVIPVTEYKVFKMIKNVPEYRIGIGDTLEITLWEGIKETHYRVIVSPQGTISFSYVIGFNTVGFTQTELEGEFIKLLQEYVKKPIIKVEVPEKVAHTLSIFGAVRDLPRQPTGPGTYTMYGRERITQFLSRAGGHLPIADLTRVQLTRGGKTYFLNLFDVLFKADYRQDVFVDDGDVIFIPAKTEIKNKVFVFGEVKAPGLFQYDVGISLFESIIRAGGPTFYGKIEDVVIIRGDETKPEAIKSNLKDIYERGDFRQNIALQNNDIVYVSKNTVGNIANFIRNITPILGILRFPMDLYGATAVPRIDGFPLIREAAPTPTTVITTTPTAPPLGEGERWGESR